MTDDLISRTDAIEAIARLHALNNEEEIRRAYRANPHSTMTDFEDTLVSAFDAIYDIPSAQPKRGEWIRTFDGNEWFWYCSNCKTQWYEDDLWMGGNEFPHFCPNCGARMTDSENPNNCDKDINVRSKDEPRLCRECEEYAGDGMYCAANHLVYDFDTCKDEEPLYTWQDEQEYNDRWQTERSE